MGPCATWTLDLNEKRPAKWGKRGDKTKTPQFLVSGKDGQNVTYPNEIKTGRKTAARHHTLVHGMLAR
jgi:hypothetical protein